MTREALWRDPDPQTDAGRDLWDRLLNEGYHRAAFDLGEARDVGQRICQIELEASQAVGLHAFEPYPQRHTFAETRMIFCPRCGATRYASGAQEPMGPCIGPVAVAVAVDDIAGEAEAVRG